MTPEQMQRIADRLRGLGFTDKADRLEAKIAEISAPEPAPEGA